MIQLKRAYDAASDTDGRRFLVERLWPRGITTEDLEMEAWVKEAAPSTELRRWFNHDPERWVEFRRRYVRELAARPESWAPLVAAARRGPITLVYSSRDSRHNNAVALKAFLESRLRRRRVSKAVHRAGQRRT